MALFEIHAKDGGVTTSDEWPDFDAALGNLDVDHVVVRSEHNRFGVEPTRNPHTGEVDTADSPEEALEEAQRTTEANLERNKVEAAEAPADEAPAKPVKKVEDGVVPAEKG